jgi:hypothetical protein
MARITIEDDMSRDDVKNENPVARQLGRKIEGFRRVDIDSNLKVEELVLKYGRPFISVDRPKGFRLGAKKECFLNSYYAADKGQGFYVEGYGLHEDWLFHHAWITLDGLHAVDVTLRGSVSGYQFFRDPDFFGDNETRSCGPARPTSFVGSRFANRKNGGSPSKGDGRSAGLRPLRGAGYDAFDHVGQFRAHKMWA